MRSVEIINGTLHRKSDALAPVFEYAPVQVRAATAGRSKQFPLAVLLANPAGRAGSGALKLRDGRSGGYTRPERVDGHDHSLWDSQMIALRDTFEEFQSFDAQRLKLGIVNRLEENRDDLLTVARSAWPTETLSFSSSLRPRYDACHSAKLGWPSAQTIPDAPAD